MRGYPRQDITHDGVLFDADVAMPWMHGNVGGAPAPVRLAPSQPLG
jgi:hypothetical protein